MKRPPYKVLKLGKFFEVWGKFSPKRCLKETLRGDLVNFEALSYHCHKLRTSDLSHRLTMASMTGLPAAWLVT